MEKRPGVLVENKYRKWFFYDLEEPNFKYGPFETSAEAHQRALTEGIAITQTIKV